MLIEAPEDPFDAFHPLETISIIPIQISAPTLSLLPREIRHMIYTDLIVAGDLELLRTSKAVCQEMTQLLYKRGVCRIVHDKAFTLKKFHAFAIQNLEICLTMGLGDYRDLNLIKKFNGSSVCRQNCHIILERDDGGTSGFSVLSGGWREVPPFLLDHLRALMGFKKLTIGIRCVEARRVPRFLQSVKDELEGSLGEGIWHGRMDKDHGAQYLEFYPRGFWETQQEKGSSEN